MICNWQHGLAAAPALVEREIQLYATRHTRAIHFSRKSLRIAKHFPLARHPAACSSLGPIFYFDDVLTYRIYWLEQRQQPQVASAFKCHNV